MTGYIITTIWRTFWVSCALYALGLNPLAGLYVIPLSLTFNGK